MRSFKVLFQQIMWFFLFDYFKYKYSIKVATTDKEKENIFKFRYKIYQLELSQPSCKKNIHGEMIYDEYDFKDNTLILYSGTSDHITGTLRIVVWDTQSVSHPLPKTIIDQYDISEAVLNNTRRIGEMGFFLIEKSYRNSLLGLTLISSACLTMSLIKNITPDLIYCYCMPGLIYYYLKIGPYPYTNKLIFDEDGFGIPLVGGMYDFKHLKKFNCLVYYLSKRGFYKYKKQVSKEEALALSKDFSNIIPPIQLSLSAAEIKAYRGFIKDKKLLQNFDLLIPLVKDQFAVSFQKNCFIIKKNVTDYDIYFIMEGEVGIYLNDKLVTTLTAGSLVGEMAILEEEHQRSADVKGLTNGKMIIIPRNLFARLEKHDPKKATQLLFVMCQSLHMKLQAQNKRIAETEGRELCLKNVI